MSVDVLFYIYNILWMIFTLFYYYLFVRRAPKLTPFTVFNVNYMLIKTIFTIFTVLTVFLPLYSLVGDKYRLFEIHTAAGMTEVLVFHLIVTIFQMIALTMIQIEMMVLGIDVLRGDFPAVPPLKRLCVFFMVTTAGSLTAMFGSS